VKVIIRSGCENEVIASRANADHFPQRILGLTRKSASAVIVHDFRLEPDERNNTSQVQIDFGILLQAFDHTPTHQPIIRMVINRLCPSALSIL
jgi:hypothetical protein